METLQELWLAAVAARQEEDDDKAREHLEEIVRKEPRLAEPHLELGHMAIDAGDLGDAEAHVRLAVEQLERGNQWVDDLPADQLLGFAHNLLGEILFARADLLSTSDDRAAFDDLWNQAADEFARAHQLDPENPDAKRNAFSVRRRGVVTAAP